jgi:hypothetical protein
MYVVKNKVILVPLISIGLLFGLGGCLEKDSNISGELSADRAAAPAESPALNAIEPYASCTSLTPDQIFELSSLNPDVVSDGSFEEGHSLGINKWTTYASYGE